MIQYIERLKILIQKMELQGCDIELGEPRGTNFASIKIDCRLTDLENGVDELLGEKEEDI